MLVALSRTFASNPVGRVAVVFTTMKSKLLPVSVKRMSTPEIPGFELVLDAVERISSTSTSSPTFACVKPFENRTVATSVEAFERER